MAFAVSRFVYKNGPCGDWGTKENFYMKKLVFLLLIVIGFSSCVLNRTYISDYREQIRLMKANFPEIYELYRQGDVIITSVYTYEKDGQERVHIEDPLLPEWFLPGGMRYPRSPRQASPAAYES